MTEQEFRAALESNGCIVLDVRTVDDARGTAVGVKFQRPTAKRNSMITHRSADGVDAAFSELLATI